MEILNQIMADTNPLASLLAAPETNHIGYVYSMGFKDAMVLTNDAWKERVAGIPHNSFLIAGSFDPTKFASALEFDKEVVLLRVIGPASLPQDVDMLRTRIEHSQRRTADELFGEDVHDGLDPLTHAELQYGGLKCRVLGTFYLDDGHLKLGSDIENYMCSTRLRVFKPRGDALSKIVNHINQEVLTKSIDEAKKSGFKGLPSPIEIGTVRYTSTARLHRGATEPKVPVMIQPSDFLSRRTAVLGMTRTGKSNTVKTTVAAVTMAAKRDGIRVGQIIFDLNGEYANATGQDDGSSIAEVFSNDTIRYRGLQTEGFLDMRNNFYEALQEGLDILQAELSSDGMNKSQDIQTLMNLSLVPPNQEMFADANEITSATNRWKKTIAIYRALLFKSDFQPASNNRQVSFPAGEDVLSELFNRLYVNSPEIVTNHGGNKDKRVAYIKSVFGSPADGISLGQAVEFFTACRETIKSAPILTKSKKPWFTDQDRGLLNLLVGKSDNDTPIRSTRVIGNAGKPYHSPTGSDNIPKDIYKYLLQGKIVIVDLSVGVESVRKTTAERIASNILYKNMEAFSSGQTPSKIVIYVEEAHNIIGKDADFDTTWPRIAKEGAKAGIALVFSTQEPSSVHPNILANTENWFVTHLNNDDELRALSKFYDFVDFQDSLKTAQDVGFARIKTLSSPFVVPTQIKRFTPDELKAELQRIAATNSGASNAV
ncbi:MAG: ATP-binding protein [Flavisolibacter sp.]